MAAIQRSVVKNMLTVRNKKSNESPDEPSRAVRWFGFWFSMALFFVGIHLMKESSWSWLWFVPMLLPFMGVLQMESERPLPLGLQSNPEKKPGKIVGFFDIWSASIIAFIGIYLMIKFSTDWYWFIPFLILFLVLLPQKMKEWEKEDGEKKVRKAERRAQRKKWRDSSPVWTVLKIVFSLGVLWLVWQWVGFYLWMFVLSLAR